MYNGPYNKTKAILTIKADIIKMHSLMQELSTLKESSQISEVAQQIYNYEDNVFDQFKLFEKGYQGNLEKFMELKIAFIDWKPVRDEIINLSLANMMDVASRITNNEGITQVNYLMDRIEPFVEETQADTELFVTNTKAVSNSSLVVNLVLIILSCCVSILIAATTANSIVRPIKQIHMATMEMAQGNLSVPLSSTSQDEIGSLTNALSVTLSSFHNMITDVTRTLDHMAKGDMAQTLTGDYRGDFMPLRDAMNQIILSLNQALLEIGLSTNQVAASSASVLEEAVTLSQTIKLEAEEITSLNSITVQVSGQAEQNSKRSFEASELTAIIKEQAADGNNKMKEMLCSMERIEESSSDIQKMVAILEHISYQTTVLSLNASIEAARSGEHGKGFAVVAEQVRLLAAQSAKATDETRKLATTAMENALYGQANAKGTAIVLDEILKAVESVFPLIKQISEDSSSQTDAVGQIHGIVEHIREMAQQNASGAELSEAESSKLSKQAANLQKSVDNFRLLEKEEIA